MSSLLRLPSTSGTLFLFHMEQNIVPFGTTMQPRAASERPRPRGGWSAREPDGPERNRRRCSRAGSGAHLRHDRIPRRLPDLLPRQRHRRAGADKQVPARRGRGHTRANTRCNVVDAAASARVRYRHQPLSLASGAELRVLAVITDPRVIAAILAHLQTRSTRAPPLARH